MKFKTEYTTLFVGTFPKSKIILKNFLHFVNVSVVYEEHIILDIFIFHTPTGRTYCLHISQYFYCLTETQCLHIL